MYATHRRSCRREVWGLRKGWQGQQGTGHRVDESGSRKVMALRPYRQRLSLRLCNAPPRAEQTIAARGSRSHSPAHEPPRAPHGLATKFKSSWLLAPKSEHSRWPFPPLLPIQLPRAHTPAVLSPQNVLPSFLHLAPASSPGPLVLSGKPPLPSQADQTPPRPVLRARVPGATHSVALLEAGTLSSLLHR